MRYDEQFLSGSDRFTLAPRRFRLQGVGARALWVFLKDSLL